jgi:hypothetical protein
MGISLRGRVLIRDNSGTADQKTCRILLDISDIQLTN